MNNDLNTVKQINRATLADGKMIEHFVVDPLSANDELLLQNINEIYPTLTSVYTTVKNNSADNWDNAKLSGFSAFNFNSTAELGAANVSKTLELTSSDKIKVLSKANRTLEISASPDYAESYYARSMKMNGYVDDNSVSFNGSSATKNSFVYSVHSSATEHGVIFARAKSFASDFGVVYSLHRNYSSGIATHSSVAIYNSEMYGTANIGLYQSTADDYSKRNLLSYFSKADHATSSIAKYGSYVNNANNVAMYNSSAIRESFAFYDSYANGCAIASYNGAAIDSSVAMYDSFARTSSVAFDNSTANNQSIAIFGGTATDHSVAIGDKSEAKSNSIALSSTLCNTSSIGFRNTYAGMIIQEKSIAAFNTEKFTPEFGFETEPAAEYRSIALYNAYASHSGIGIGKSSASWQSISLNDSCASDNSISINHSDALHSAVAINFGEAMYESVAIENAKAEFSSYASFTATADHCSVARYSSSATQSSVAINFSTASNKSVALFDSVADDCSIALFNSTASHSALSLYSNTINIKHDGSVNGLLLTYNGGWYVD